ncbi:histidine phosphotransferase ChpT [Methylobacterium gnaphalii]|uniref:Histidine phosphotransferase n=1 Tax=Methylobacterium gnaphalii TaxID=1010610 RepID=A0A512JFQ5_9HYPH|nr:histidine phosphotransferase family protein [Methylobacterium gnaphalii]GEP08775.1 histidine phosphotransferase [Methylobacterium gnaphalii]GJD69365.1 Protein phosphotransferase ChpT [Methylobacterium gnaphalii]GLS47541.1 histidine phosphotransferase [Methylobacterium gnaphalii]
MASLTLDALDLSALLCSRVCHDLISPVGAINNGLEVLEDDNDPSMREFALDLIRKSARTASARVQFARIAFGASGSVGAAIDLADAEKLTRNMFADEKPDIAWSAPVALFPKNKVKLLLNLVVIASTAIPRGGLIDVKVTGDGDAPEIVIVASGSHARIPPHAEELIAGTPENGSVDSHGILAYYAGLVARAAAMSVHFSIEGDAVTIRAVPTETAAETAPASEPVPEDARPSDSEPPDTALA